MLSCITIDDGCVPGAGDLQTGTVNIGDIETSDMGDLPSVDLWPRSFPTD